jgi:preprotein translocase subunit SecG
MTTLFVILIVIAAVALGFIVLIQNPKGGGLASNVGGLSNQLMGVKQTTDVLEKGTWIFASVIGVLAMLSTLFLGGKVSLSKGASETIQRITPPAAQAPAPVQQQQPAGQTVTIPATPAPAAPKGK